MSIPFTKYFCKNGYTHTIGSVVTTIVARRTLWLETCWTLIPAGIETTALLALALAIIRYKKVWIGCFAASLMYMTPVK